MKQCKNMEIWFAELPVNPGHVEHGKRPVLIVSNDTANKFSPIITIVPLTSKTYRVHLPTHVFLQGYGLSRNSLACCEQVMSLDKSCLVARLGEVGGWFDRMAIQHALAIQLNLAA